MLTLNEDFINARAVLPMYWSTLPGPGLTVHYLPGPAALKGPSSRALDHAVRTLYG